MDHNEAFMNLKNLFLAIFVIAIQIPNTSNALLGPSKNHIKFRI